MAKRRRKVEEKILDTKYRYKMSQAMYDEYKRIYKRTKDNKKDLRNFILDDINSTFGLKGVCVDFVIG